MDCSSALCTHVAANAQELIIDQEFAASDHVPNLKRQQTQSATKKQETHNQARARAVTLQRSQSRPSDAALETILLLLLLLPHQNVSEMQRKQVGSLTLGALTLSLALSPHAATPAPRRKKFRICIHTLACSHPPRLRAFVGMVWSTENKGQHG